MASLAQSPIFTSNVARPKPSEVPALLLSFGTLANNDEATAPGAHGFESEAVAFGAYPRGQEDEGWRGRHLGNRMSVTEW